MKRTPKLPNSQGLPQALKNFHAHRPHRRGKEANQNPHKDSDKPMENRAEPYRPHTADTKRVRKQIAIQRIPARVSLESFAVSPVSIYINVYTYIYIYIYNTHIYIYIYMCVCVCVLC